MENIETQEQTIYIESWTLIDFALALEEAFYEGYEVSDKNEYAPIQIGGCYACTLVKVQLEPEPPLKEDVVIPQLQPCVVQQDEIQSETQQETSTESVAKPRGRKPSQK